MNRKAFTLIELLVVVAIIGILAAVGVVAYNGYTASAKKAIVKSNHKLAVKLIKTELINAFKRRTGCPSIVNTSFNVRGEPIICSPSDAFKCFMGTELDVLAIGNYLLLKKEQDEALKENYKESYELD